MGGLAQRDVVAVLTRAPSAGGKSRLFAELGIPPDAALLRALFLDTVDALPSENVTLVVAVEPASACDEVRALVTGHILVIPQSDGTLGDRMAGVMREMLDGGARSVALVGSDLPALRASSITRAFVRLHDDPSSVVLGPAADGGYYLIAASRVPDLFADIGWGTERVLDQTQSLATKRGIPLHLVDATFDIDTVADLVLFLRYAADNAGPEAVGHRTRAWAREHGITAGK